MRTFQIRSSQITEAEQVAPLKIELKEAKTQRDKSQDKELEDAIEKISNSNKDGFDSCWVNWRIFQSCLKSAVPANAKTKLGENKTKWKEDRLLISVR
jgi:hypothetical protein